MNMCIKFQVDIFKNGCGIPYHIKHVKKQALFTSFWDLTRAPLGGGGYFEPPLSFSCDIF